MTHLIVVRAFGPYRVGDVITGEDAIGRLAPEHLACVVRIHPPEET